MTAAVPPATDLPPLTGSQETALRTAVVILLERCEHNAEEALNPNRPLIAKKWLAEKARLEADLPDLVADRAKLAAATAGQRADLLNGLGFFFKRLKALPGTLRGCGKHLDAGNAEAELKDLQDTLSAILGGQQPLPMPAAPEPSADEDQPHARKREDGILSIDRAQSLRAAAEKGAEK